MKHSIPVIAAAAITLASLFAFFSGPTAVEENEIRAGMRDGAAFWLSDMKPALEKGGAAAYMHVVSSTIAEKGKKDPRFHGKSDYYRQGFMAAVKCIFVKTGGLPVDNTQAVQDAVKSCTNTPL